ncbi:MAG: hypothetical protein RIQ52_1392 [Pseudomonadota bacterium]|jgi:phosphoglycolate phosphatase
MMSGKAVLFDLDGTLVDSAADLISALDHALQASGLPSISGELVREHVSHGARGMMRAATGSSDEQLLEELVNRMLARYEQYLAVDTRFFDGIAEILDYLDSNGIAWGIITNKTQRFTIPLAEALQLKPPMACLLSGDTLPQKKPHPAPLLEAAMRLNCAPEHCVYIGDAETDVIAGRSAGMTTVVAAWGYIPQNIHPADWQGDVVAQSPADLLQWLKTCFFAAGHVIK